MVLGASDANTIHLRARAEINSHFGASAGRANARRRDAGASLPVDEPEKGPAGAVNTGRPARSKRASWKDANEKLLST